MKLLKTILFVCAGSFLGLTPVLSYYFTHGPSCPCHSLLNTGFYWTAPEPQIKGATDRSGENAQAGGAHPETLPPAR